MNRKIQYFKLCGDILWLEYLFKVSVLTVGKYDTSSSCARNELDLSEHSESSWRFVLCITRREPSDWETNGTANRREQRKMEASPISYKGCHSNCKSNREASMLDRTKGRRGSGIGKLEEALMPESQGSKVGVGSNRR